MPTPFEILSKQNFSLPKTIVQVGASGGQELDEFIAAGITDALLIEPLDMPFSILQQRVANIPTYVAYKALVSSTNGHEIDFFVASNGGMSSSILEPDEHLNIFPYVSFPEKIKLTGYRLDSLFAFLVSQKIITFVDVDMLYIDVQGAELFILKGAGELLENIKYIWTEVGSGAAYKGSVNYRDLINFLHAYNFELAFLEGNPTVQGDALFVKV